MNMHIPEHYIRHCKRHVFLLLVNVLITLSIDLSYAENKVVLIAAKGSGIESISNRDLRRVFLGLKSADSEIVNRPVINLNNKEIYEEFLKNIMHMTEGAYKRKLVKRIFRNGAVEIKEVEMLNELNVHLTNNVGDISFVENTVVDKMTDIEVIKVLW